VRRRKGGVRFAAMEAPTLVPLFTLTAQTTVASMIPNGPTGTRVIVDASSGTFDGDRLRGTVHGPGGDWLTVRSDGNMHLDVRLVLRTDDGADVYMAYEGIGKGGVEHITTLVQFQTGAEQYAWLNGIVAVGRGASGDGFVTYDVYEVA
jgi:hypothetical protein